MTSMPKEEQMTGIQSTNLMCTLEPFLLECEYAEASMKKKKPRENSKSLSALCCLSWLVYHWWDEDSPTLLLGRRLLSEYWGC